MTGYGCAYDDDCPNQINWLLTSMNPSFTISLCDDHLAPGVIPLLGANIGVDAGKLYESIKRFTDREAAREAKEAAIAPASSTPPAGNPADRAPTEAELDELREAFYPEDEAATLHGDGEEAL